MSTYMDHVRAGLIARGIPAYGNINLLAKYVDTTAAIGAHLAKYFDPDKQFTSLATAEAAMTSLRCDTLLVTPEAHSLAAALTWDLSCSNLVGMSPSGPGFAKRARIGMSTTFTPMITVSGYGNTFNDVYTQHGTAAGDYVSWLVSGTRNVFNGVHFAGPMNAAQGGHASYAGVSITGSENVFNSCIFGSSSIGRDELTPNVTLTSGTGAELLTIFNQCTFVLFATDTDPYFISAVNADGLLVAQFNGCKFICVSNNNAVKAAQVCTVSGAAPAAVYLNFDSNCEFVNVSHYVAAARTASVHMPTVFAATADELNLIAINSASY